MADETLLHFGDIFDQALVILRSETGPMHRTLAWQIATDCAEQILAETAETVEGRELQSRIAIWRAQH